MKASVKRKVTDLIRGSVLYNLSAEIGGSDGAEVLLIGLGVACVFEEHVRGACRRETKERVSWILIEEGKM